MTEEAEGPEESGLLGCGCVLVAVFAIGIGATGWWMALHPVDAGKMCGRVHHDECMWRAPARVVSVDPYGPSFRAAAENGTHTLHVDRPADLPKVGERVTLEEWETDWVSYVHTASGRRVHTDNWEDNGFGANAVLASVFTLLGLLCVAFLVYRYAFGPRRA